MDKEKGGGVVVPTEVASLNRVPPLKRASVYDFSGKVIFEIEFNTLCPLLPDHIIGLYMGTEPKGSDTSRLVGIICLDHVGGVHIEEVQE